MKALITSAVFAALLVAVSAPAARAQHPEAINAPRYKIAVVDISYIFKDHARFKQQIESMKTRMEALDKQFTSEREAIAAKEQERNQFKPNTPEYKNLDRQVTQMKADLAVRAEQEQKTLMQEEANMYFITYQEVQQTIEQYANRHDLALVLRFNGDPVDPAVRQDIIRGINRPVVYQNKIDITPDVLNLVNRGAGAAGTSPTAPGDGLSRRGTIPPQRQQ